MTFDKLQAAGIRLHAIVAMASNRVIGKDGDLPWHLSEDLKLFKQRTLDHPIIMGRTTFESLPKQRPLPRRRNIVLSRTMTPRDGLEIISDLEGLVDLGVTGDAFLIGGARVFDAYLSACTSIILTSVYQAYDGDTVMPSFEDHFAFAETLATFPEFEVCRYRRRGES